jgi:imidazoleglycerol-phosphate dehydratase
MEEAGRSVRAERKTAETTVVLELNLDGNGQVEVSTGIGFFDHMLTLLAFHAGFDLRLEARGDLEVDQHHTVEDVGLVLGAAMSSALGKRIGIRRYGWALLPMDEALSMVALDLSGRPYLSLDAPELENPLSGYDTDTVREFLRALVNEGKFSLHIKVLEGENPHHVLESVFKGIGRALRDAVRPEGMGIPSSKGAL